MAGNLTTEQGKRQIFSEESRQIQDTQFYRELYSRRVYKYDAISGAQIRVKFGSNVIVEDATAVQFTLSQGKKPIYGYASKLFDAMADGVVIVHGRIWLNFIHQGYLRLLLEAAKDGGQSLTGSNFSRQERLRTTNVSLTPVNLLEHVRKENLDKQQGLTKRTEDDRKLRPRPDERPSVDITINYGNPELYDVPKKVIYECHFLAEGQELNISGQPIMEWYEFVAKKVT